MDWHPVDNPPTAEKPRKEAPEELARRGRKPYRKPRLVLWGDLRGLTLGPSPGVGESGNPAMFKV